MAQHHEKTDAQTAQAHKFDTYIFSRVQTFLVVSEKWINVYRIFFNWKVDRVYMNFNDNNFN